MNKGKGIVNTCREKQWARVLLLIITFLSSLILLVIDLVPIREAFFPWLFSLVLFLASLLLLLHSVPAIVGSRYYQMLKQPFLNWALFVIVSTYLLYHISIVGGGAFIGVLDRNGFGMFRALTYVINLLTFSDSGEVVPVAYAARLAVMLIKIANLAFLIWFIAFIVKQRLDAQLQGDVTASDFARAQESMQDILRKSVFVNEFFKKLDADIAQSQENIDKLEQKRKELERLRSIEQTQAEALVSSLGQVVERELRKTSKPNFISNITASVIVALGGYLIGKLFEAIIRHA